MISSNGLKFSTQNDWTAKLKTSMFNTSRQIQQPRVASGESNEQETPNLLPQIGIPPNSADQYGGQRLNSMKGQRDRTLVTTAVGIGQSYLTQRQTQTNYNKKRTKVPIRSGWMKESFNNNASKESEVPSKLTTSIETHPATKDGFDFLAPTFELSATHNEVASNKGSDFSKAFITARPGYYRIDKGVLTPKSTNPRVSPASLQLILN
jgi:hypothetical protein